jgi:hypothetical protein
MEEYRAYLIGPDGHIINRVDIRAPDQLEARVSQNVSLMAMPMPSSLAADRFIARFEPEH